MNVTGKEIQDNEDPKDRQKDAGITIFVFQFKFPFVVLSAAYGVMTNYFAVLSLA